MPANKKAILEAENHSEGQLKIARRAARAAGLHYVRADAPGICRLRRGKSFQYVNARGQRIRSKAVLERIQKLVIPPAWKDVWICSSPTGHLQVTGRDARGRKQYLYHRDWRTTRDHAKFQNLLEFGRALPELRRSVERDLRRWGLHRDKILAAIVKLMRLTLIRVGNAEYAQQNHSYGLTTLRSRHVRVRQSTIEFQFRGKSGVKHMLDLDDPVLARIVKRCHDLPGQELFKYRDRDGKLKRVGSEDVNDYLYRKTGQHFTAKVLRTWGGSVLTLEALLEPGSKARKSQKSQLNMAIESCARALGNTKSICKKSYIHPAILEAQRDGLLPIKKRMERRAIQGRARTGLSTCEREFMDLLLGLHTSSARRARA